MQNLMQNLEHVHFRQPWGLNVLFLLIAAALFVSALIYFGERLALWKRILLGSIRVAIFAIIIVLLFEPVEAQAKKVMLPSNILILLDVSESMGFIDPRKTHQDLEDAALALGKMRFSDQEIPSGVHESVAGASRFDIARGLLEHPELKIFQKPGEKYRLKFLAFGDKLEAAPDNPEKLKAWLKNVQPKAPATHLGDALVQARDNFTGQPVAAIIVLTDGASNAGVDPLDVADTLQIPVFALPIGLLRPEDVRLVMITAPDAVFPKDRVEVEAQIEATPGFLGREVDLILKADGKEVDRKKVTLKGNQFEKLAFIPEKKDDGNLVKLDVSLTALPNEATEENNQASRTVELIDKKINVLYIEGKPRWEYRYLRAVLSRDHRMNVKFFMTEGDPDLYKVSPQYIARVPQTEKEIFEYDLVILGEIRSDYFTAAQQDAIEKLVRDRSGCMLMLAGHQYAPMSYADTPIGKMLPVKLGTGREILESDVHPVPTQAGLLSQIMKLEFSEEENNEAWAIAKPLFDVPRLGGIKPGATVLATLSTQANRANPYPLIAWQRYGTGKTMYVGSDQLWRLRFKRGDAYHAQFWGQAIQFLTLSRLLGENKRMHLVTDRKDYKTSDRVIIQATLLDEEIRPLIRPSFPVLVEQVPSKGEPRTVVLKPVANIAGMYQGFFSTEQSGNYMIRPQESTSEKDANMPFFRMESISREKLELDVNDKLLRQIMERSGGAKLLDPEGKNTIVTVRGLPTLLDKIPDQSRTVELPPEEREIWDNWWVFSIILVLASMEWFLRRSNDIA